MHLVGGPRTVEASGVESTDELGLIVLPLLLGGRLQLTPFVSTDTALKLD